MSEWDVNQTAGYDKIETTDWEMIDDFVWPNAWGYFAGGHKKDLGRNMLNHFALRMFIGSGTGAFVRAEKFFDVPERYRKFRKSKLSQVEIGEHFMNVVGEGMFPFRMWSVDAEEYISINLLVVVVEDVEPIPANECHLDMWLGLRGNLPFRRLLKTQGRPEMFMLERNASELYTDEEWVDVGAWTHATKYVPELRPKVSPTLADGIRHQMLVVEWFKAGEFHRLLQLSAAGARPRDTPEAEFDELYTDEDLNWAVTTYVESWERMLQEDTRRQLEGGEF